MNFGNYIQNREKNPKTTNISDLLKKTDNKTENTFLGKKTTNPMDRIKDTLLERDKLSLNENKQNLLTFSSDMQGKEEPDLINYYCSLCGATVMAADTSLDSMPRRKTDDSLIVLVSKIKFKNYLKRDKLMVVKRDFNKYEKQYRFVCNECGVFVAYQAMDYEENETTNEFKRRSNKIFSQNKKKILYILIDAVVADPRQSSLFIEMDKIKDSQEKKMSSIRLKKTELDEFGKEKEKIVYL